MHPGTEYHLSLNNVQSSPLSLTAWTSIDLNKHFKVLQNDICSQSLRNASQSQIMSKINIKPIKIYHIEQCTSMILIPTSITSLFSQCVLRILSLKPILLLINFVINPNQLLGLEWIYDSRIYQSKMFYFILDGEEKV